MAESPDKRVKGDAPMHLAAATYDVVIAGAGLVGQTLLLFVDLVVNGR